MLYREIRLSAPAVLMNCLRSNCYVASGLFLIALCWLSNCGFAGATDNQNVLDYRLQFASRDKWLEIYSDSTIDENRCKMIAERVRRAYQYDFQKEGWSQPGLLWTQPLALRVVHDSESRVLGYAIGGDLFVVRDSYLDDCLSEGTLAHELTHIQDARQLGIGKLPSWLLEGRALVNGHNYRISKGQKEDSFDRMVARSAINCSVADAQEVLDHFQDGSLKMQNIGTFVVEYMRTKWHGHGFSNVQVRLSRMIETIGAGQNFETAFQKEFKEPFSQLKKSFENYLKTTSVKPQIRLKNTIWQNTLKGKSISE